MTSSKPTKVGSFQKRKMAEKKTVSTHKPLNLNFSLSGRLTPKSLMCGSLNVQPIQKDNYHFVMGDNYDEKRICTLQSKEVQLRCKNSNSKNWKSLQVQHQLPYYMDSKVSEKSLNWKGGICA